MEYFDIVDEFGEPTGETVERGYAHLHGIRHRTSHVWLARKRNNKVEILLQMRSSNKDSYPGCYDISSAGHIPAGCGYVESAIRELKEELGIDAEGDELIHCGDRTIIMDAEFYGKPFHDRQRSRVFFMWCDREEEEFIPQPEELECVKWMELEELISGVKNNHFKHCIVMEELMMLKDAIENKKP